ncbi:MAG: hypothetical protein Kow0075_10840 [Salibacteraceae bacterium]
MTTEERILSAARQEFLEHGYDGSRMRSIAERARINKGLLHYYFKSKEALLQRVFESTFNELFGQINEIVSRDLDLFVQLRKIIIAYTDFVKSKPELPYFIASEMRRNPALPMQIAHGGTGTFNRLKSSIREAAKNGLIRPEIKPEHVIVNMMSLVLFPFITKAMVCHLNQLNEDQFNQFIEDRKEVIAELLINDLKPIERNERSKN